MATIHVSTKSEAERGGMLVRELHMATGDSKFVVILRSHTRPGRLHTPRLLLPYPPFTNNQQLPLS